MVFLVLSLFISVYFIIVFGVFVDFLRNLCDCANRIDGGHLLFAVLTAPIFTLADKNETTETIYFLVRRW